MSRQVPSALISAVEACMDSPLVDVARSIDNSARALRFNKDDARRLARYVQDLVDTLDGLQQPEDVVGDDGTENALLLASEMKQVIADTQTGLDALSRRSYVSQVLYQQRDKEKLNSMWNNLHDAFDVLKVKLSLTLSKTITARDQRSPTVAAMGYHIQPTESTSSPTRGTPLVPPLPQLFGRAAELEALVCAVTTPNLGHVAILGGPGMGKTSLALAALHHPLVLTRFEQRRYFVACDAAEYKADCLSIIASAFGYSGQDHVALKRELLRALAGAPTLLVLDNFESAWEEAESRANAEQLLRSIVGLGTVALVLTLRGAERPQGVPWSRPFLPPLCSLSDDAAKQTFIAISDVPDSCEATAMLARILGYMENIPLALVLMANQAQYETLATLLGRWHDMKTAMLTRGDGKQRLSSLDVSIATSLHSPRMRQRPEAERLLSLLSLLPVGAMQADLAVWGPADQQSVSVLLQTALVYQTDDERLRVLTPIREFMLANHAPTQVESAQLYKHFFGLPRMCIDSEALASISTSMAAIIPELDNLEFLILYSLRRSADKTDALKAAVNLAVLYSNGGMRSLRGLLPVAISVSRDGGYDSFTGDLLTLCATGMANTNMRLGDPVSLLTEARAMYERIETAPWRGLEASMIMMRYLTPTAAIAEGARVIEIARAYGYRDTEARCKRALAAAYERVGRVADALVCQEEALAILREIQPGPDSIMADSMVQIAVFHGEAGRVTQAATELRDAQTLCEYLQDARCLAWVHLALGQFLVHQGSYALAIVELQQSLDLCRKNQNKLELFCLSDLLIAHLACDDTTAALDLVRGAEVLAGNYGPVAVRVHSYLAWMHGELALYGGHIDEARAALMVSRTHSRTGHDPNDIAEGLLLHEAKVCIMAGRIEQADGRQDEAASYFILAAVVRAKYRICTDTVCALARLAEVVDDVSSAALLGATMVALHRFGYLPQLASSLLQSARLSERLGQLRLALHRAQHALRYFIETGDKRGGERVRDLMAHVKSGRT